MHTMLEEELAELRELHAELKRLLSLIEAETSKTAPDMAELAAVRFKLTRASRSREIVISEIVERLGPSVPADLKDKLVKLRDDVQRARFASAEHIGRWTTRAISSDWQAYRAASQEIRSAMRRQIDKEASLFELLCK